MQRAARYSPQRAESVVRGHDIERRVPRQRVVLWRARARTLAQPPARRALLAAGGGRAVSAPDDGVGRVEGGCELVEDWRLRRPQLDVANGGRGFRGRRASRGHTQAHGWRRGGDVVAVWGRELEAYAACHGRIESVRDLGGCEDDGRRRSTCTVAERDVRVDKEAVLRHVDGGRADEVDIAVDAAARPRRRCPDRRTPRSCCCFSRRTPPMRCCRGARGRACSRSRGWRRARR